MASCVCPFYMAAAEMMLHPEYMKWIQEERDKRNQGFSEG